MNEEFFLDYRFSVTSPAEEHHSRVLTDMMENTPNPMGLRYVHHAAQYSGRLTVRAYGEIGISELQTRLTSGAALFTGARTRSHVARNRSFGFHLVIWQGGKTRIDRGHGLQAINPGDFFILDTDTLFNYEVIGDGHGASLFLPASWERIGDTKLKSVFCKLYQAGEQERNNKLIGYVRHLLAKPGALSKPGAAEKLYDVVALALNPEAKSAHQTGLLELIRSYIDKHCRQADLDAGMAAAEFGISVRHLHRLFAAGNISFSEYLLERRLELALQMLGDRRYQNEAIMHIAYNCGFRDINHFGRRFRERYGITPGEARRAQFNGQA